MMSITAATIALYSFNIEGSCYTTKISLPKMINLESLPTANPMEAPPSLPFVCPRVSASLFCLAVRWSGCLLIVGLLVHAQRHTPDAGDRLNFGCTAANEPLITLHVADWADNLRQSHQALEATLGAHTLITPTRLDKRLRVNLKFRYQTRDLVKQDNFI